MAIREPVRSGGRSARVQQSVHAAVRELLAERPREALTLPIIAARAGVTPSTLYRRWGDLPSLLADASLERLRPDAPPVDTGSLHGDLLAWVEQYVDELGSEPGRAMIRDFVASGTACQCAGVLRGQLQQIVDRAQSRGEVSPSADTLLDRLAAPTVYRVMFSEVLPDAARQAQWVEHALLGE
ncbi:MULTISPECIES: TetR/AcrR family transcriptional regulator [unclassified Pseudomonas]|uniref:TetR/AcrR family transcriptional regulator n=1 Tax=unclassified Pseudomonas TaxID=196821 RepID=UPI000BCA88F8|nr:MULTISPECIES: TetR/AcrR family transcriptional regulator [unclassified Pseudomonas]PVZ20487.1 TetR family transcriptional regulator [Pseudomonas sp. URIL14HWK12:I12]PVZ27553.1 TetR family transcriptional regulator [Pseudomonas sp. URIL14HWK12:I10]PVZ38442.1 TetR family transcriptional regulator [Pseudomonas sp. URIL14HWK12:I11]SNZ03339.1 transcriptional regulator, TetR family [Pseudomonas sp. URIL14HWK12:I9]